MSDKDPINIAKQVYDYNKENPDNSRVTPLLPPGVVGKFFTCQSHGKPFQNAIVFEDGSELVIAFNGDIFWPPECEWESEESGVLQVKLKD